MGRVCKMMRLITEYDVKMTKELAKWSVYPKDDSDIYLREDAPEEVKKYYEKLRREDSMFD